MTIQPRQKTVRESNIELLRIILMLMIIGYHLIVHGAGFGGENENYVITDKYSVAYILLKSFLVIAVNCFVFISGFYRITFRIGTVISMILQTIFYALIIYSAFTAFSIIPLRPGLLLEVVFPIFKGTWWFITAYFGLYLISPLLNKAVDSCSREQLLFIVVIFTVLNAVTGFFFRTGGAMGMNGGYSLLSFVHIYLLGRYISRYVRYKKFQKWSVAVYISSSLVLFLLVCISINWFYSKGIIRLFSYNNPLVIVSAVSFFFVFKSFRLQNSLINQIASGVLGVYLLHDHRLVRKHVIDRLFTWSESYSGFGHFLVLLLIALLVLVIGLLVDKAREILLAPVAAYLGKRFRLNQVDHLFRKDTALK